MKRNRDDFSSRTKSDLALRAGFICSLCKKPTVGPSEEGPNAVAIIGVAAHICAASAGQGARRYDSTMTKAERSHISNGIWLCASCSVLIDRDDQRFSVDGLRKLKSDHENSRRLVAGGGAGEEEFVGIGSDFIALGKVIRSGPDGIRTRLSHFVSGSGRDLMAITGEFSNWLPKQRCVLFNELGIGRELCEAPAVESVGTCYEVSFVLQEAIPRRDARDAISTISREKFTRISGLDAYAEIFESILGMSIGTWFGDLDAGSHISDLYWRYKDTSWFCDLAKMEMIRLASVSGRKSDQSGKVAPFCAVSRVDSVEVPSFGLTNQRLAINVRFELHGVGPWERTLSVFISTPDQLIAGRKNAKAHNGTIQRIERSSGNVGLISHR